MERVVISFYIKVVINYISFKDYLPFFYQKKKKKDYLPLIKLLVLIETNQHRGTIKLKKKTQKKSVSHSFLISSSSLPRPDIPVWYIIKTLPLSDFVFPDSTFISLTSLFSLLTEVKMGPGGEGMSLEFTPTWVVAAVCTVIVAISLAVERLLHYFGTVLKKKKQKPLYEALQKVKEGTHPHTKIQNQNPFFFLFCEWVPRIFCVGHSY